MPNGASFTPSFIVYLNNSRRPQEREAEIKEITIVDRVNMACSSSMRVSDSTNEWRENDQSFIGSKIRIAICD